MIMNRKLYIISLLMTLLSVSCNDNLSGSLQRFGVEVEVFTDDGKPLPDFDHAVLTFKNISTGTSSSFKYPMPEDAEVLLGLYDVTFEGVADGMTYYAVARSVEIVSNSSLVRMSAFVNRNTDDLIIAEVFFSGTLQTSGNQYYGDDYVKLYNNTDHVVYADGVTLFESKFLTTEKRDYFPDRMDEGVTVQALYTIPGNGNDHPVQPGEYILLADTGIDHRQVNPNSFNLSHADWEWYDLSNVPSNIDIDSPDVKNLDKWYCYTKSVFMLHNRGYRAVGIARISGDKNSFLSEAAYSFDYETVTIAGTFPMSDTGYLIPIDDVIDVVNCSVPSEWAWNVTHPSLDRGFTGCGSTANDKNRYFKSVRRKLLYITQDGRPVLKDTDNSSDDFNGNVIASEIELQSTVCDINGSVASTITYDGVTPIDEVKQ